MKTISIHEAKIHLSQLIERGVKGEFFIIAKAGKPLVRLMRLESPSPYQGRRIRIIVEQIRVADDFNRMHAEGALRMFGGDA